jgi:hypothetical protein
MKKILFFATSLLWLNQIYSQCTIPGSVTATPSVICAGSTTSLNATSAGSFIKWYNAPACGIPLGTSASGANFVVTPSITTTYYAEAYAPPVAGGSLSLNYSGCIQMVVIPAGVNQVTIDARGAQGGFNPGGTGGSGAQMIGTFTVTPGQILYVLVGQSPGSCTVGGYTFPAGGGGSFVGTGNSLLTSLPLIAAGGGGGGYGVPGDNAPITTSGTGNVPGTLGMGAPSTTCGGGGGGFYTNGGNDITYGYAGGNGFRQGGAGGPGGMASYQPGGFGGGAPADYYAACNMYSGAGGGYSGGSGYNSQAVYAIGAAGGSFNGGTSQTNTPGFQLGNGQVNILGLSSGSCVSISRTPVTVTVNPAPAVSIAGGTTAVCANTTVTLTASGATSYTWSNGAFTSTIAPTPTANVSYTVSGSNGGGCAGTAIQNLTVNPSPTVALSGNTLICGTGTNVLTASGANSYSWSTGAVTTSISASPTITTNYTVVGTSSVTGCANTTTTSITVSSNPTIGVNSGSICSGSSFTIVPTGASTYSFQGGNAVVSPTASANYTVIGTNTAGCISGTFAVSNITVNALPAISVNSTGSICAGQSATLTASGANTYSWNTGASTSSVVVSPTTTTVYTAMGTSSATGCMGTATINLIVNSCTGIYSQQALLTGLLVYPNPSNGEFNVELKNGLTKTIEVSDYTGKVVLSISSIKDVINVNLSSLADGIYNVKIQSNNALQSIKVVKSN